MIIEDSLSVEDAERTAEALAVVVDMFTMVKEPGIYPEPILTPKGVSG